MAGGRTVVGVDGTAVGLRSGEGGSRAVALRIVGGTATAVAKRSLVLVDVDAVEGPYHAAVAEPGRADEIIDAAESTAAGNALVAVRDLLDESGPARVVGVVLGNRPPPDRAQGLRSHVLTHAAEGGLFRQAVLDAAHQLGLPVFASPEAEVVGQLAARLGTDTAGAEVMLRRLGATVGRPWRRAEQLAAAVAWLALLEQG